MSEKLALVVEDESDLRELYTLTLEGAGYRVVKADSVGAARKALKDETPTIVILDLMLPGGSGRDILKEIRENPRLAGAQVAVMTAYPGEATALREEADLVLIKPFSVTLLKNLIARLTESSQSAE